MARRKKILIAIYGELQRPVKFGTPGVSKQITLYEPVGHNRVLAYIEHPIQETCSKCNSQKKPRLGFTPSIDGDDPTSVGSG